MNRDLPSVLQGVSLSATAGAGNGALRRIAWVPAVQADAHSAPVGVDLIPLNDTVRHAMAAIAMRTPQPRARPDAVLHAHTVDIAHVAPQGSFLRCIQPGCNSASNMQALSLLKRLPND